MLSKKNALIALGLVVAWTTWASINFLTWVAKGVQNLRLAVHYHGLDAVSGFLVTVALVVVLAPLRRRTSLWLFVLLTGLVCFLAGSLRDAALETAIWLLGDRARLDLHWPVMLAWGGLGGGAKLGLFLSLAYAIDHGIELAQERERASRATALAQQAQLQMLRYQLNPHFLFNAMNSIRAMILEDSARARDMVTELAEFLRYSLDATEQEGTVADELQAIDNYLAIQRIRFEDQLEVSVQVDEAAREVVVPCFLVHPLVENAVKHGMQTSPLPLRIQIEIRGDAERLEVRVSNTGRLPGRASNGTEDREGTGTGIRNIEQRLRLAFPHRHSFSILARDGWVHARLHVGSEGGGRDAAPNGSDR